MISFRNMIPYTIVFENNILELEKRQPNYSRFAEFSNKVSHVSPYHKRRAIVHYERSPIISYGTILLYKDKDQYHTLICKRSNTPEFVEFVKNKYRLSDLFRLFSLMTLEEKQSILSNNFNDLWDKAVNLRENKEEHKFDEEYKHALKKFEIISPILPDLIDMQTFSEKLEGFPKGRKQMIKRSEIQGAGEELESDFQAAKRECKEETGIDLDLIKYTLYARNFYDATLRSNGRIHVSKYFVFLLEEKCETKLSFETSEVSWRPVSSFPSNSSIGKVCKQVIEYIEDFSGGLEAMPNTSSSSNTRFNFRMGPYPTSDPGDHYEW